MITLLKANLRFRFLTLCAFVVFSINSTESYSQIVTIPDANFVSFLQTNYPSCITGNQMDTQCPEVISATHLYLVSLNIADFSGVEYFTALEHLDITDNDITALPSALPTSLTFLNCGQNNLGAITTFPVAVDTFYCNECSLTNLVLPEGSVYVDCAYNFITAFASLPSTLKNFRCAGNSLNTFPAFPSGLETLDAEYNDLTSLPTLPSTLVYLLVRGNNLTSLPTLPASLHDLYVGENPLGSLPTLPSGLENLWCNANGLTSLPFLPNGLTSLTCQNNSIASLPTLPNSLGYLDCAYNPLTALPLLPANLVGLHVDNCELTAIPELPEGLLEFFFFSNPNLNCLPRLPDGVFNTNGNWGILDCSGTGLSCIPNIPAPITVMPVLPVCQNNDLVNNPNACEVVTGIYGYTYRDGMSGDCIYDEYWDDAVSNVKILLLNDVDDTISITYTGNNGAYSFMDLPDGSYQVVVDTVLMPFAPTCINPGADSAITIFNGTAVPHVNFALGCASSFDVGVQAVFTEGCIFPGLDHTLKINMGNISSLFGTGCGAYVEGDIEVTVDGPVTYVGPAASALSPTSITGNVYSYHINLFSDVNFFTDFGLIFSTDTTATADDTICVNISLTTVWSPDINPTNNNFTFCYPVSNSYDPNIKTVYPQFVLPEYNNWLNYTIHFQNTGNAPAHNIKLVDTLDVLIRENSFELLTASHPVITVQNASVLTFKFNNIMLPDSASDPLGSIGTVQFRVKPVNGIPDGTDLLNRAYIYFDYNTPIITNYAQTSFIYDLGEYIPMPSADLLLYPNPGSGLFTLAIPEELQNQELCIKVYDITGAIVLETSSCQSALAVLDLSLEKSGVYFIQLQCDGTTLTEKLVKL
jgi:uncharacterized repeat protein (TIGR01451 family)